MARQSLASAEMIAAFGAPKRIPAGRTSGITKREWDARVRGVPMEKVEEIVRTEAGKRATLKLRCGHGAR